jgi:biotin carboxylase
MVLGGSSNQVDLIIKAKAQGDFVVLVDYLDDCDGIRYADMHLSLSTFDIDGILDAAKKHHIEAIISSGTDQPIFSAAKVSEDLGLNFYIDTQTALAVTNKRVMKKMFFKNNIPSVDYRLIQADFCEDELSELSFPVVLKPVDSQGQRGIFKLNSIGAVREKIDETLSFSRENAALVEQFYENDEITINGWVTDGIVTIISVVDRVTIKRDSHIGICLCHNYPSVHVNHYAEDIETITNQIVRAFNIKNGPIYFQYLVGKHGIKVNEIAMRIGGAYEGITIPLIANLDILKMALDSVKIGKINEPKLSHYQHLKPKQYVSTQLFFCNPGRITSMTPIAKIQALPCVKSAYYAFKKGDTIPKIENATARAGYFVAVGDSFDEMINNVSNTFDNMQILDENGKNLVIKYTDYENKYLSD